MRASEITPTVVALDGDAPVVTLDGVSKRYEEQRIGRTRRLFSVFGGIEGDVVIDDADDDDDDDDDGGFDGDESDDAVARDEGLVLDDVHLELRGSGGIGVVGARPEGRSALLRLIAGLAAPAHGRVVVEGRVAPLFDSLTPLVPRQGRVGRQLTLAASILRLNGHEASRRLPEIMEFTGDPPIGRKTSLAALTSRRRQALLFTMLLALEPDIVLVDTRTPRSILDGRLVERIAALKDAGALVVATGPEPEDVAWIADSVVEVSGGRVRILAA